ncbi:MAG: HAD-IA family hydrolase [Paracoccaceae bacterium]
MQPQAVIFDIGNVLLGWNPEAFYDGRIGPARRRAFFAEVPMHAANLEIDRGAPFAATVQALADAHPDWATQILWWHDDWLAMITPVITQSVATLQALRAHGLPVFALTNFGAETYQIARAAFPFLTGFDRAFVSGEMRLIKPDPAIYTAVEFATGLPPQALLFTDDKVENTDAAAARGWQTHVFTGWRAWAERLVSAGLLTPAEAGI